ncbi:class I SAM-dependent methyltransferase [Brachyspira hyodysenteriae]|uniref:methyltransferase domain-containing protein n=3 Tax=Brachyspira hyodysenteriae TaxID=159 RepID=UPI002B25976E|nr:methyltransferase domain-containing protein [Brachyspira hyodysenteriae]WPC23212.1 class I SAM-dependent methyltransferase [Brachyspira hyodysenteriae]
MENLSKLYSNRFNDSDVKFKDAMWKVLCKSFFQKYINSEDTVIDIAGGYCEFINNINCKRKIVADLNESVKLYANKDVEVYNENVVKLDFLEDNSIDKVFISNFLEHIDKDSISKLLKNINNKLKRYTGGGGYILIMGPNIKYCYNEYWDFFDHHTPLSEKSVIEALEMNGFSIVKAVDRFLPFSTKSKLPKNTFLIWLYLKLPIFWKIFGKQFFIVAKKN